MIFLYFVETLLMILLILLMTTQVAIPLVLDRPLFPFFSWWSNRGKLTQAGAAVDQATYQQAVQDTFKKAKAIRKGKVD